MDMELRYCLFLDSVRVSDGYCKSLRTPHIVVKLLYKQPRYHNFNCLLNQLLIKGVYRIYNDPMLLEP